MARALRLSGSAAWIAFALFALLAPALAVGIGARPALDWQPSLAWSQPWRIWSATWVHFTFAHLLVNAAGAMLVAALGWAARVPPAATLAWALAWPATHIALALRPEIAHYGGLSGVLHAGVAIAALCLLRAAGRARAAGGALLAGLALKVALEAPWREALPSAPALGIASVPLAHAAGAVAGTLAALLCTRRR